MKNRVKTLLIPYLIWNTLELLLFLILHLPFFHPLVSNPAPLDLSLRNLCSAYWVYDHALLPPASPIPGTEIIYPINVPLWFLRNLMVVVLCTPVLYRSIRKFRYLPVVLLGGLWMGKTGCPNMDPLHFITAFFFFAWGAYMSIWNKDMVAEFGRFFRSSMILYPLLALLCFGTLHGSPEAANYIKQANILVGLLFAYNLATWLLQKGYCKATPFLAASSFFIYVSHILICSRSIKLLAKILEPASEAGVILVYLTGYLATVGSCLVSFWLLKRYLPSLLRVLTGRK